MAFSSYILNQIENQFVFLCFLKKQCTSEISETAEQLAVACIIFLENAKHHLLFGNCQYHYCLPSKTTQVICDMLHIIQQGTPELHRICELRDSPVTAVWGTQNASYDTAVCLDLTLYTIYYKRWKRHQIIVNCNKVLKHPKKSQTILRYLQKIFGQFLI